MNHNTQTPVSTRYGTFNVRGCNKIEQKITLADDMIAYDLDILGITETHIPQSIAVENIIKDNREFVLFSVNNEGDTNHGVGFITKKSINPTFNKINERICTCSIKLKDRNLIAVSAYAPTLDISKKNPELRDDFYEKLGNVITKVNKRDILLLLGDFNAKTGSGYSKNTEHMGKYGKGN